MLWQVVVGGALCCVPVTPAEFPPLLLPLSFSSSTTSLRLPRNEDWQQGSSVIWDTRERDPFTSKMSYCNCLPLRPLLQKHGMPGHVSYGPGEMGLQANKDLEIVDGKEGAELKSRRARQADREIEPHDEVKV